MKGHSVGYFRRIFLLKVFIIMFIVGILLINFNNIKDFVARLSTAYIIVFGIILILSIIFTIIGILQITGSETAFGVFIILSVLVYGFLSPAIFLCYENVDAIDTWLAARPTIEIISEILLIISLLSPVILIVVSAYIFEKEHKVVRVLVPFIIVCIVAGTGLLNLSNSWIMVAYFATMLISQVVILISGDERSHYRYTPTSNYRYTPVKSQNVNISNSLKKKDDYEFSSTLSESTASGTLSREMTDLGNMETVQNDIKNLNTPGYEPDGTGGSVDPESPPSSGDVW